MPFLTNDPLPQCLQPGPLTPLLLALGHQRGGRCYLSKIKCLRKFVYTVKQKLHSIESSWPTRATGLKAHVKMRKRAGCYGDGQTPYQIPLACRGASMK